MPAVGFRHSAESKARMSVAKVGQRIGMPSPFAGHRHSEETKQQIAASMVGEKNHMWGRPVSAEHRAKNSAAHLGLHPSKETRAKMSIAHKGKSISEEARKKRCGDGNPMKRPEIRAKFMGDRNPMRRPEIRSMFIGDKNPNWKGGIKHSPGYESTRIYECFYLYTHRLNMARMLGRKLEKDEIVHHVNHDRKDNRPENLALCSNQAAHRWCDTEEAKVFLC